MPPPTNTQPAPVNRNTPGGPRAMSRVLRLFNLLARERNGLSLSEISTTLSVPKSTFLGTLRGLVADGFIINEGNDYRLGPQVFRLAATIMSAYSPPDVVRHYVRELASLTQESVGFGIADWESGKVIYIDAVNSTQPVHVAMRVGLTPPLYASAAGRVLMAFASDEQRENYLARAPFKKLTSKTLTTRSEIREALKVIQHQKYCISSGEMLADSAAMAAPVFDAHDQVIGAMMVGMPLSRLQGRLEQYREILLDLSRQASGTSPLLDTPAKLLTA